MPTMLAFGVSDGYILGNHPKPANSQALGTLSPTRGRNIFLDIGFDHWTVAVGSPSLFGNRIENALRNFAARCRRSSTTTTTSSRM